jgi:hypothetical protein
MVIYYIGHVYLRPYVYFFLSNFPGSMSISCPTSLPEASVFRFKEQALFNKEKTTFMLTVQISCSILFAIPGLQCRLWPGSSWYSFRKKRRH